MYIYSRALHFYDQFSQKKWISQLHTIACQYMLYQKGLEACNWAHADGWKHPFLISCFMPEWPTKGLCIFLNASHLEVSIVELNASFHRNSLWITSVIGLNGQMFHRWRPNWDLSNWRPNVVHPESLSSSSVTFKVCACVCFASQVFRLVGVAPRPPRPDTNSATWFILLAEMKSLVVVYSLWAQIRSINLRVLVGAAYCSWPSDPSWASQTLRSVVDILNQTKQMATHVCESVNQWPLVHVCGFWSEVTRECQLKMSLQKRFASSLKLCHHVDCLTAWCEEEKEMCRDLPISLCAGLLLFMRYHDNNDDDEISIWLRSLGF